MEQGNNHGDPGAISADRRPLPVSHRHRETAFVLDRVAGGESCWVIGVSGSGKSNFARFLTRPDVHAAHLGPAAEPLLAVLVDSHKLAAEATAEVRVDDLDGRVYELMLHGVLMTAEALRLDDALCARLDGFHQRLLATQGALRPRRREAPTATQGALIGLRHVERALNLLVTRESRRVVFVFDQFDDLVADAGARLFLNLRGLRDEFKYQVMFVAVARDTLSRLRPNPTEIEAFAELFESNTIALGGYTLSDARDQIQRLAGRFKGPQSEPLFEALWQATGGHPGLLRAAYRALCDGQVDRDAPSVEALAASAAVAGECQMLWDGLSEGERGALAALSSGTPAAALPQAVVDRLAFKQLLGGAGTEPTVAFPVLAVFAGRQAGRREGDLQVDQRTGKVWVLGRPVENIPALPFKLLLILSERRGEILSYDTLIEQLYPGEPFETGISDERIYTLASRLRRHIEPDPRKPRFVLTVRDIGLKLAD